MIDPASGTNSAPHLVESMKASTVGTSGVGIFERAQSNVDKGIEALTYSSATGHFYAGIQGSGEVLVLELTNDKVSRVASFSLESGWAPSGLYAHSDGHLYIVSMRGRGSSGDQMIFKYDLEGTLKARIMIPTNLGMTRPDGIAFDEDRNRVFIVDSQGHMYGGYSLYRIDLNPSN